MAFKVFVQTNNFGNKEILITNNYTFAKKKAMDSVEFGFWYGDILYPPHVIDYIEVKETRDA